jgi:hypothetical protein
MTSGHVHAIGKKLSGQIGLILCAKRNVTAARYALEVPPNKVPATEYRTALPDEEIIAAELNRTRKVLETRPTVRAPRKRRGGKS